MVVAYILIQASKGKAWPVREEVLKVKGVVEAVCVTGIYDVIAKIEVSELKEISDVVKSIHSIDGVEKTHTAIAV